MGASDQSWANESTATRANSTPPATWSSVGTHGEYYRTKSYDDALRQLAGAPPWSAPLDTPVTTPR